MTSSEGHGCNKDTTFFSCESTNDKALVESTTDDCLFLSAASLKHSAHSSFSLKGNVGLEQRESIDTFGGRRPCASTIGVLADDPNRPAWNSIANGEVLISDQSVLDRCRSSDMSFDSVLSKSAEDHALTESQHSASSFHDPPISLTPVNSSYIRRLLEDAYSTDASGNCRETDENAEWLPNAESSPVAEGRHQILFRDLSFDELKDVVGTDLMAPVFLAVTDSNENLKDLRDRKTKSIEDLCSITYSDQKERWAGHRLRSRSEMPRKFVSGKSKLALMKMNAKLSASSENIAVQLFSDDLYRTGKPFASCEDLSASSPIELLDKVADVVHGASEVDKPGKFFVENCIADACDVQIANSEGIQCSLENVAASSESIDASVAGASDMSYDSEIIRQRSENHGSYHSEAHQSTLKEISESGSFFIDGNMRNCSNFSSLSYDNEMLRAECSMGDGQDIFEIESDLELCDDTFDDALSSTVLPESVFRKQTDSMIVEISRRSTLVSFSSSQDFEQVHHERTVSCSSDHLVGEDAVAPTNVILELSPGKQPSAEVRLWSYSFSDNVSAPRLSAHDQGSHDFVRTRSFNTASGRPGSTSPVLGNACSETLQASGWNRYIVVQFGNQQRVVDRELIDPFLNIISHGGYHEVGSEKRVIMVFAACYFPRRSMEKYEIVMEQLFYYLCHTISLCVSSTFEIVYFNGGADKEQTPSKSWMREYYEMAEYRLKKNLKKIYFVHPDLRLKTLVRFSKVFLSSKSSKKMVFVKSVADLKKLIPIEYIFIPDLVRKVDGRLR